MGLATIDPHSHKVQTKLYKIPKFDVTALFNNMRTLIFKVQPANVFFANQVFGDSSQHPTTVERAVMKSLSNIQRTEQSSAVAGS